MSRINGLAWGVQSPGAKNSGDLVEADRAAPTQNAKLSDAQIDALGGRDATRWVIVAQFDTFYRIATNNWESSFGAQYDCSNAADHYSGVAAPSDRPSFLTPDNARVNSLDACGSVQLV